MCKITKKCNACLEEKEFCDFYRSKTKEGGIDSRCKKCHKDKNYVKIIYSGDLKTCTACKEILPIESFFKHMDRPDGYDSKCKKCNKAKNSSRFVESVRYTIPKLCKCCGITKTEADFSIHSRNRSGYKSRCKECIKSKTLPINLKIELEGIKTCRVCSVDKPYADFYNIAKKKDGKNPKCKQCVRDGNYLEEVRAKDGCKICSKCSVEKSLNDFHNNGEKTTSACKICLRNEYYLKHGKDVPPNKPEKPSVEVGFKICNQCKIVKETSEFGIHSRSKDRLSYICKKCACKNAYDRNPPKNLPTATKEEKLKRRQLLRKEKYLNDPLFRLETNLRSRINDAYKCSSWLKNGGTIKLLGSSYENAMFTIESQFIKEMNWSNQGNCKKRDCDRAWHLDHIIPFSWAKNEEEMILICHYSNLQPMWDTDNMSKHNKVYPCTNLELGITFWQDRYEYIDKLKNDY
jgi:hypothetical protein